MATEFTLRRAAGEPLGSFEDVRALILRHFPETRFGWTSSGPEKLRLAAERGVTLPPELATALERLPPLLEGVAEGQGYHVTFGLGHEEPVTCLRVTPRGSSADLVPGLAGLAADVGGELHVSGES